MCVFVVVFKIVMSVVLPIPASPLWPGSKASASRGADLGWVPLWRSGSFSLVVGFPYGAVGLFHWWLGSLMAQWVFFTGGWVPLWRSGSFSLVQSYQSGSKFDLLLLPQCGNTYSSLCRSVPEIDEPVLVWSSHLRTLGEFVCVDLTLRYTSMLWCEAAIWKHLESQPLERIDLILPPRESV